MGMIKINNFCATINEIPDKCPGCGVGGVFDKCIDINGRTITVQCEMQKCKHTETIKTKEAIRFENFVVYRGLAWKIIFLVIEIVVGIFLLEVKRSIGF